MRVRESASSCDRSILIVRSGTSTDRLTRWPNATKAPGPNGFPMGPRQRLVVYSALAGILILALLHDLRLLAEAVPGSWGFPMAETSLPVKSDGEILIVEEPEGAAMPGGAAVAGAALFEANGCYACHSLDGERKIGPSLRGIFGTTVELNDGSTVPIDESYVVESILYPEAKRVAGYDDAAMPSYEGIVSAEDASVLAEYIKGVE
jgi:mono/diheme cytochrome c family protein